MHGTGPDTGKKNFDVKLGWVGENKKFQFRNQNASQHLQEAVIYKPSSSEEGWADWTAASLGDKAFSAPESGLGIPLGRNTKDINTVSCGYVILSSFL